MAASQMTVFAVGVNTLVPFLQKGALISDILQNGSFHSTKVAMYIEPKKWWVFTNGIVFGLA